MLSVLSQSSLGIYGLVFGLLLKASECCRWRIGIRLRRGASGLKSDEVWTCSKVKTSHCCVHSGTSSSRSLSHDVGGTSRRTTGTSLSEAWVRENERRSTSVEKKKKREPGRRNTARRDKGTERERNKKKEEEEVEEEEKSVKNPVPILISWNQVRVQRGAHSHLLKRGKVLKGERDRKDPSFSTVISSPLSFCHFPSRKRVSVWSNVVTPKNFTAKGMEAGLISLFAILRIEQKSRDGGWVKVIRSHQSFRK